MTLPLPEVFLRRTVICVPEVVLEGFGIDETTGIGCFHHRAALRQHFAGMLQTAGHQKVLGRHVLQIDKEPVYVRTVNADLMGDILDFDIIAVIILNIFLRARQIAFTGSCAPRLRPGQQLS